MISNVKITLEVDGKKYKSVAYKRKDGCGNCAFAARVNETDCECLQHDSITNQYPCLLLNGIIFKEVKQ